MLIYRICLKKWSSELKASGQPARWNSKGKFVIYTAENRSLACLENLIHRSGYGLNELYKILVISVPDNIKTQTVTQKQLPKDWREFSNYYVTQKLGDRWIESLNSCILKVPSSIIVQESNYLINLHHEEFNRIRIESKEDFNFDKRLIRDYNK